MLSVVISSITFSDCDQEWGFKCSLSNLDLLITVLRTIFQKLLVFLLLWDPDFCLKGQIEKTSYCVFYLFPFPVIQWWRCKKPGNALRWEILESWNAFKCAFTYLNGFPQTLNTSYCGLDAKSQLTTMTTKIIIIRTENEPCPMLS